jgi:hypothetical protein
MFRPKGHNQVHVHLPAYSVVLFTLTLASVYSCSEIKLLGVNLVVQVKCT